MMLYSMNLKRPGRKTNMYIKRNYTMMMMPQRKRRSFEKTFQNRFVKKNEAAKLLNHLKQSRGKKIL